MVDLLVQLGNYVSFTAAGDVVALVSSGIPVQKDREPMPPLDTPIISKVEDGVNSGELRIIIERVKGARTYVYQYAQDPLADDSGWVNQNSTLTKLTVTGLELGKRYWCRIIACGKDEQEVFSDAVLSRIVQ